MTVMVMPPLPLAAILSSKLYRVIIQKTVTVNDGNNTVRRLSIGNSLHVFLSSCSLHQFAFLIKYI